jgi:peptidoglycan-associated lipoprotein
MRSTYRYPVKLLFIVGLMSLLLLSCGILKRKERYRTVPISKPEQVTGEMEKKAQAPEQAPPISEEETARRIRPLPGSHEVTGMLKKVYFDYDKSDIRDDQRPVLDYDAQILLANPDVNVLLEGHCDERGTVEYNFALGGRRATSVKDYLIKKGVKEQRLATLSKGEEEPVDPGHTEEAWMKNRRVEFIAIE